MPALILWGRNPIDELCEEIRQLRKEVFAMALSQEQFDDELSGLITAVDQLIIAIEAMPPTDLTEEGQAVSDAAARVRAELDKINPSTPTDVGDGGGDVV